MSEITEQRKKLCILVPLTAFALPTGSCKLYTTSCPHSPSTSSVPHSAPYSAPIFTTCNTCSFLLPPILFLSCSPSLLFLLFLTKSKDHYPISPLTFLDIFHAFLILLPSAENVAHTVLSFSRLSPLPNLNLLPPSEAPLQPTPFSYNL